ncbi:granzyme F-like [Cimex lectularius]|uniref:Peptidase S1 domain-containing protein n=1 Tax=Cimex lectularius TaxID=79782 RepID=A0A8I6RC02_CIMLE|nr:granzyme F-like [Cimex lectularius]
MIYHIVSVMMWLVLIIFGFIIENHGRQVQRNANYKEFPFMIAIVDSRVGLSECGGALVSDLNFVTAGHCVTKYNRANKAFRIKDCKLYFVVAGSRFLWPKEYGYKKREVQSWRPHSSFDTVLGGMNTHDIAVGMLASPMNQNDYVHPIRLFSHRSRQISKELKDLKNSGDTCFTLGWGRPSITWNADLSLYEYANDSHSIRVTQVKLLRDFFCSKRLCKIDKTFCNFKLSSYGSICGTSDLTNSSIYPTDAGGPLVCRGMIFGVVGWVRSWDLNNTPIIYSNVKLILEMDVNFYSFQLKLRANKILLLFSLQALTIMQ